MKLLNAFRTIRSGDWWEHKLPPILAIGYATAIGTNTSLIQVAPSLLFLLLAITIGAIYVSTINDIADMEEDRQSGKSNRMEKIAKKYRWIIPLISIFLGIYFFYSFLPDILSASLYLFPWITFSLYSFKPFRLKQKGIWGLFCDAGGAHLFISLLIVSSITYKSNQPIDVVWFSFVGLWSLCFGLRSILWHQYLDRDNDLKVNANTFATKLAPGRFVHYENWIIGVEFILFFGLIVIVSLPILYWFVLIYFIVTILRYKVLGHKPVIVLNPVNSPFQILLLDLYQVLFPLGLLFHVAFTQKYGWVLLIIHIILFPKKLVNILTDLVIILKTITKNLKTISSTQ